MKKSDLARHEIVLGALLSTALWAIVAALTSGLELGSRIELAYPIALTAAAAAVTIIVYWLRRNAIGLLTLAAAAAAAIFTGYSAYDAHKNYTLTQRPFVALKELKIELVDGFVRGAANLGTPAKYWVFTPIIENSGNTLTKNLRIKSASFVATRPAGGIQLGPGQIVKIEDGYVGKSPPDPADIVADPAWMKRTYVVAPHASLTLSGIGRTIEAFAPGSKPWFVMGAITYNDIFENTPLHQTKYCFQIGPLPPVGEQKPGTGPCLHWNCTDDECIEDRNVFDAETSLAN